MVIQRVGGEKGGGVSGQMPANWMCGAGTVWGPPRTRSCSQKLDRSRPNTWALSQSKRMRTRLRNDTCLVMYTDFHTK